MTRPPLPIRLANEGEAVDRLRIHLMVLDTAGRGNDPGSTGLAKTAAAIRWLAASAGVDLDGGRP